MPRLEKKSAKTAPEEYWIYRTLWNMQPALAIVALIVAVAADEQCSFNKDAILKDAESCKDWITTNRRTLHRQPELLYDLQKTEAFITTQLDELSVQYERGIAKTGCSSPNTFVWA